MPNPSKDKGSRLERAVVAILTSAGLETYRVPLSGATKGFKGDVMATINGQPFRIEAKSRGSAFKALYRWLEGNQALVVKADRQDALIVMPLMAFAKLVGRPPWVEQAPEQPSQSRLNKPLTDIDREAMKAYETNLYRYLNGMAVKSEKPVG